jgi:hypothetical protein
MPGSVKSATLQGISTFLLFLAFSCAVLGNDFDSKAKPILSKHCFDCHGDGMKKGNVTLDEFKSDQEVAGSPDLWLRVLKNVRAGLMPPAKKERLSTDEMKSLEAFIKRTALAIDPAHADPGRVTIRRLNRVEYKNTIRDLMGIEFNADDEFPPDDSGYGFDNIGDVLTISPLLLEKYLQAAEKVVAEAVPTVARYVQEKTIPGKQFSTTNVNAEQMSFYKEAAVTNTTKTSKDGDYKITLDFAVRGAFNFDPGRADIVFKIDDVEKLRQEFKWENGKKFQFDFDEKWKAGEHTFVLELQPLSKPEDKKTSIDVRVNSVKIRGPLDPKDWVKSKNYDRFFFKDEPPASESERREYAREILARVCKKAFRRPVDARIIDRLTTIAETGFTTGGKNFEQGVAQAIVAVLATPRFLFRSEETVDPAAKFANVDEYALASRLSYFLWSSMPDDQLFELAERGELRKNLRSEIERMLEDERSRQLVDNFTGQWLQIRDVAGLAVNERAIFARERTPDQKPAEGGRRRFGPPKVELDDELRRAMQAETRMYFSYIMREDRSVLEMLDSDYTFVNAKLAKLYDIPDVEGKETRRVTVPKDSPRGGMLTHASLLLVTSNPTRTSPVKRGLFLLDNFFGTPPPPPPDDVPPLEDTEKEFKDHQPTLRETLEIHRAKPLCSSCHNRMDPLGLAMENFNALGLWREQERGQKIDAAGKLVTGETFSNVRELKQILATKRYVDFYRCLTEKLLTYALGRGLEYYDVEAVDKIVDLLEADKGRFSSLLIGVIESVPFQQRRNLSVTTASAISENKTVALEK